MVVLTRVRAFVLVAAVLLAGLAALGPQSAEEVGAVSFSGKKRIEVSVYRTGYGSDPLPPAPAPAPLGGLVGLAASVSASQVLTGDVRS